MPLIEVEDGVRLNVLDVGSGPPLMLVHGWALSHEVWDRQVLTLAERGWRVLAPDLRGHGNSDAPLSGYAADRLARDLVAVLDDLRIADISLVGWSLGGLTAFNLAATRPERVNSLVLVGSNGVANSRTAGFPFGLPASEQEDHLVNRERASRLASRRDLIIGTLVDHTEDGVADWLLGVSVRTPSWVGIETLRTLLRTDQVHLLSELSVPVTQIIGNNDPIISQRGALWLKEQLPDSTQVWLDRCGHFPMLESADDFDRVLLDAVATSG